MSRNNENRKEFVCGQEIEWWQFVDFVVDRYVMEGTLGSDGMGVTEIGSLVQQGMQIVFEPTWEEAVLIDPTALIDKEGMPFNYDQLKRIPPGDSISIYFRQMAEEPLLTHEGEAWLAKMILLGKWCQEYMDGVEKVPSWVEEAIGKGQVAREHLGRANTRLVVSIAKRYRNQGLPMGDLIQEGNAGLMVAVDKYDYTTGNRFSTYASWWIRQTVARGLSQKSRTIRLPIHRAEKPDDRARFEKHTVSLEQPVGEGDSELGDFIEDEGPTPERISERIMLVEEVDEILSHLQPREAKILRLRFGLGGGVPLTLEQVAAKFGLSRERIRQIEKGALKQLGNPRRFGHLRDHLG